MSYIKRSFPRKPPDHVTNFEFDEGAFKMFEEFRNYESMEKLMKAFTQVEKNFNRFASYSQYELWKHPLNYSNLKLSEEGLRILEERKAFLEKRDSLGVKSTDSDVTNSLQAEKAVSVPSSDSDAREHIGPSKKKKRKKKKRKAASNATNRPTIPSPAQTTKQPNPMPQVKVAIETEKKVGVAPRNAEPMTRNFKYLIRGIHEDIPIDEIYSELQSLGFVVTKIVQFRRQDGGVYKPLPLFLIILPEMTNHRAILRLQHIRDFPIQVEKYRSGTWTTQCFRCQNYGHSQRTCTEPFPRCIKCAEQHQSYECSKNIEVPKCCNCGQPHTANFSGCPARPVREEQEGEPAEASTSSPTDNVVQMLARLREIIGNVESQQLLRNLLETAN